MKRNKIMAGSLFLCSIAIIVGMIIDINSYWFVVDIFTIVVCCINAILLIKNK